MNTKKVKTEEIKAREQQRKQDIIGLIERAKGENRSYSAYAKAAGISPAAISRIMKGDYLPTPDTMKKLTSIEADPQGGVTFEEMMRVAGYTNEDKSTEFIMMMDEDPPVDNSESSIQEKDKKRNAPDIDRSERRELARTTFRQEYNEYERIATSLVYSKLVDSGVVFKKVFDFIYHEPGQYRPFGSSFDLLIDVMDQEIKQWNFEFKYWPASVRPYNQHINQMISGILFAGIGQEKKVSFVINNEQSFQYLKRYEHVMPIRGEVSVILCDYEKMDLVDEFYLSNYIEGDHSKEIYLIKK